MFSPTGLNDSPVRPTNHGVFTNLSVRLLCALHAALLLVGGTAVRAQTLGGTSETFDASVAPRHSFRFSAFNSWTRFDQVYGLSSDGKTRPLGALFSSDSLGSTEIPALQPVENTVRALTGNPALRLSLGKLTTSASSRVVQTPLALEYGVTNRLSLGLMVPFVITRTTVIPSMNPKGNEASVGPNPAQLTGNYNLTSYVVQQLRNAATGLSRTLANCETNASSSPDCPNLLAHASDAQSLVTSTNSFATNLGTLYGTSASSPGSAFVPIAGGTIEGQLAARVAGFNSEYQSLAPNGSFNIPSQFAGANAPIAYNQLDSLTVQQYGIDSLGTTRRLGLGDIEIGGAYQLFDRLGDTSAARRGGVRARAALTGVVRLGTGTPPAPNEYFDLGTGQGQTGVRVGGALDLRAGRRIGATMAAHYEYQITSAHRDNGATAGATIFPLRLPFAADWKPGNVYQLEIQPRLFATEFFGVSAHYVVHHQADDLVTPLRARGDTTATVLQAPYISRPAFTEQRFGLSFTYSSLESYSHGRSIVPLEIRWVHLETIHAAGIVPKYFTDQLGFRLYYQAGH